MLRARLLAGQLTWRVGTSLSHGCKYVGAHFMYQMSWTPSLRLGLACDSTERWYQVLPCHSTRKVTLQKPSMFRQPGQPEAHAHERNHAQEVAVGLIHVPRVPFHYGRAGVYTVRERAVCSITHGRGRA